MFSHYRTVYWPRMFVSDVSDERLRSQGFLVSKSVDVMASMVVDILREAVRSQCFFRPEP